MSYPNAIEVCRADLFTKESELQERYPQVIVDRVLRIREMYNWFIATDDPRILGIEPIPNINEKISAMIQKYRAETIDIEDVDFEKADLQEDLLFAPYEVSDIAVILDIPADVLRSDIADRITEVSKAYRRSKAASKVKPHSQEMMLAQVGSPLALENARPNLLDMEDDE